MYLYRRLPPLNGLRAFEAAARHLSVTRAAEELHVTPAAISQQIAALEDYFEVKLFDRANRSLRLTEAAAACLPLISESFDRIAEASNRIKGLDERGTLKVVVAPAFASKWLVPRLDRFSARHADIDVEIVADYDLPDFRADGADLAIHFGDGHYPGYFSEKLFSVSAVPLCSPRLLDGEHPLRRPADLRHHRLLHDDALLRDAEHPDWADWLELAGVRDVAPQRGLRFSHSILALDAAIDAQGVALSVDKLAAPDIAAGRLVIPFDVTLPLSAGYFLVSLKPLIERPKVATFRTWILKEAAADNRNSPAH